MTASAAERGRRDGRESYCLRTYPSYRETGEGWIGAVPTHWEQNKFKHLLKEKPKTQNVDLPCGSISFGKVVYKDSERLTEETRLAYQEVLAGEFLVNPLNLNYDLKSLRTALSEVDVIVSSGYIVLQNRSVALSTYLKWLLFVFDIRHMKTLGAGIRQTITFKDIGNCTAVLPSREEQIAISTFLDRETARIDNLIAEKQNFINLLKEKRQALISHVVTKGLDPKVKMKASGIEWIGEVPEHWFEKPLKYIVTTRKGVAFKSEFFCDEGIPVVKASDIKNRTLRVSDTYLPEEFIGLFPKAVIRHKEIILSTVGSLPEVKNSAVGQVGIVPEDLNGALLNQNTVVYTAIQNQVSPEYLLFLLQIPSYREHLDLNAHGTANQASLNISDMLNFTFVVPPIDEQEQIVSALNADLQKLENLEIETVSSVELLKEHRTALISAAVTGKIDVREQQ
ncbi:MAG TPA: restriction endonuclease subunit S [Gammaproteobacteria bacterium]